MTEQPWADLSYNVAADLGYPEFYIGCPTVDFPAPIRDCRVVHGEVRGPLRDLICRRGHSVAA
jgi:hypothetical protein